MKVLTAAAGLFLVLASSPTVASACGIKSIGMESTVSYTGSQSADEPGRMAVYGKTKIDRRLALAIETAGHQVFRTQKASAAATADIVLTSSAFAADAERALQGTGVKLVIVLAPDEAAPTSATYVVRQRDRLFVQLAMLEKAFKASRAGA